MAIYSIHFNTFDLCGLVEFCCILVKAMSFFQRRLFSRREVLFRCWLVASRQGNHQLWSGAWWVSGDGFIGEALEESQISFDPNHHIISFGVALYGGHWGQWISQPPRPFPRVSGMGSIWSRQPLCGESQLLPWCPSAEPSQNLGLWSCDLKSKNGPFGTWPHIPETQALKESEINTCGPKAWISWLPMLKRHWPPIIGDVTGEYGWHMLMHLNKFDIGHLKRFRLMFQIWW